MENKIMTPEEYINSKVIYDNGYEQHSCEVVAKADALRAIEMVRNEKINSVWHDGKEMPDFKKDFIYQAVRASGEVYYGSSTLFEEDEWEFMKEFTTIERWAYVRDLLPEEMLYYNKATMERKCLWR